ncbi:hypothetical protein F7734_13765 [Scytonema sp. UIC 10036]|uniref:hypothetical protein n=1 Tax=Scytonema sp. UIC 10036 TaxID=2304196 RepID=UPI0012DA61B4|nr:hypothetical protein [Scytonema sp. UIC 10036]MUG93439.1 hypothetical protein [Scytonema sp. UIC 10036]
MCSSHSEIFDYAKELMLDLYDLIRNIQKRPAMYLGQPSISHLRTFLAGYFFARHQLGQPETDQEKHFSNFQTWIQQKYQIPSSQSWDKIILFFSPDEYKALEQFFQLFDEYSKPNQNETFPQVSQTVHSVRS